jgi:tetrapyrrole methylase family protein / MazG family protein
MTLTIVGLGPGHPDDISRRAWRALENAPQVYLRTIKHPCVPHLPQNTHYNSFDSIYETVSDFAQVYETIAEQVFAAAQHGDVVYAVPGDPLVGEATVTRLLERAKAANLPVEVINGISFVEPALAALQIDALDGLQILDALDLAAAHHPAINPSLPALIGQVYSRAVASDLKLTLMNEYPEEFSVILLHGSGTTQARLEQIALYEIDRSEQIDVLTSLYVPPISSYASFESFQETLAHLRAPEGCPWDRKQTHETLRQYLIEEAYEVLEAIDNGDTESLKEELGDLLIQVVLHTQIAIDDGEFRMHEVIDHVNRKLIRRHPHVWGQVQVDGAEQVVANWDEIKKAENAKKPKKRESLLDGVPKALPALLQAYQYTAKAAKPGFDWATADDVLDKLHEEIAEVQSAPTDEERAKEIGDMLFVIVNWARKLGVEDPETVLREANAKFYRRFRYVEQAVEATGKPMSEFALAELDHFWDQAKANGL